MAVKRTRKDFQDGMKKIGGMFDDMMEKHLGKAWSVFKDASSNIFVVFRPCQSTSKEQAICRSRIGASLSDIFLRHCNSMGGQTIKQ